MNKYIFFMLLFFVSLLSIWLRGNYVFGLVEEKLIPSVSISSDSSEYIHLAENIVYRNQYSQDNPASRWSAVRRTPGYPLFYSIFEIFESAPTGVLKAQVLIGALIPMLAMALVYLIVKSYTIALVVGLICACSTSGIVLTGEIMADLIFSFVFISGFFCLVYGIAKEKKYIIIIAGFVFGIGALIKPILVIWPFYSLFIYYFLARANKSKINLVIVVCYVSIQIIFIGGWSWHNYVSERMLTLSPIGIITLHDYLALKVNIKAENDDPKRNLTYLILNKKNEIHIEDTQNLIKGMTLKEIHQNKIQQSINIILSNPILTLICYYENINHMISSTDRWYKLIAQKLPNRFLPQYLMPKFIIIYQYMVKICLVFVVIFLCFSHFLNKKYSSDILYRNASYVYIFPITLLYFILFSGLTFWTGPRIIYPAEFSLVICIALVGNYFHSVYKVHKKSTILST